MDGAAVSKSALERPTTFEIKNRETFESKTVTLTRTGGLLRRSQNGPTKSSLNPISSANQATISKRASLVTAATSIDGGVGVAGSISNTPSGVPVNNNNNNSLARSDVFVDKMSDQQIFNREYRTPTSTNNNITSRLSAGKSGGVESVVSRLKQQISSQYTNKQQPTGALSSSTTTPNLRASQNRRSNLSSMTKSSAAAAAAPVAPVALNADDVNANKKKSILKPISILKQNSLRKSLDSEYDDERRVLSSPMDQTGNNNTERIRERTNNNSNSKMASFKREPFLVSLLMNQQSKDGRFSNMLKTKILNNQLNKLNTPVRFNLKPIVTSRSEAHVVGVESNRNNTNSWRQNRENMNKNETIDMGGNKNYEEELNNNNYNNNNNNNNNNNEEEEMYLDEKTRGKCDEWLEKHVIPYFTTQQTNDGTASTTTTNNNHNSSHSTSSGQCLSSCDDDSN